jgi:hypothetical protein
MASPSLSRMIKLIRYRIGLWCFNPTPGNLFGTFGEDDGECYDYKTGDCDGRCQGCSSCPIAQPGWHKTDFKKSMFKYRKKCLWNKLHFPTAKEFKEMVESDPKLREALDRLKPGNNNIEAHDSESKGINLYINKWKKLGKPVKAFAIFMTLWIAGGLIFGPPKDLFYNSPVLGMILWIIGGCIASSLFIGPIIDLERAKEKSKTIDRLLEN